MSETRLSDIWRGVRFFAALGPHLSRPVTVEHARAIVRRRLEHRATDFLALVRRTVYGEPSSPYRALLRAARCEYGDLEQLVNQQGLEGALAVLYRSGVYLTIAELRGRAPAARAEVSVSAELRRLRNPVWRTNAAAPSGTPARRVSIYRAMLADLAVNATLVLDARGGGRWAHAAWFLSEGARSGMILYLLRHRGPGYRPDRWFERIDPRALPGWLERAAPLVARWVSLMSTAPLPRAELVSIDESAPILSWMRQTRRVGRTPHLHAPTSAAVHLCGAAERLGMDLTGVQFTVSGEPVTPSRFSAIRRAGAEVLPAYGARETGMMAYGCLSPSQPDDLHFYEDVHAVIQPGEGGSTPGLPADALLVTSLRASSPYILLNVSLGDRAVLDRRACGCPLQTIGWTAHVHTVRSFDKLRIGAVLLLTDDVVRLLEHVLPRKFGGGPTDYQLVEDEGEVFEGRPRFRLLIDSRAGGIDPRAVIDAMRMWAATVAGRQVESLWGPMRWLTVERRPPYLSRHGKLHPIHHQPAAAVE